VKRGLLFLCVADSAGSQMAEGIASLDRFRTVPDETAPSPHGLVR
jgi:hypothetical protein